MNDPIILFDLVGAAIVVAIVAYFNWPRKKPEPHGFGDPAFNNALKEKLDRTDFNNSLRREIRRANSRRPSPFGQPARPVRKRSVEPEPTRDTSSSDLLTGVVIGALLNSGQSSSSRVDAEVSNGSSDTISPGGGEFGGAGASGSWDSGSTDSGSSSTGSD